MPRIGVIGCGFVGSATAAVWKPSCAVRIYDQNPNRSANTLEEVLECDIVFVCLPTPASEDGSCDTSALDEFFETVTDMKNLPTFVIKSTVPVGYTESVSDCYGYSVLHNPEFLTARTAHIDAITPARQLIGYSKTAKLCCDDLTLMELCQDRFPGVLVIRAPSDVTEMAKLVCNSFFAVKIAFFNEMYQWCHAAGNDWDVLMECVLSDGRIAHSHTMVPGPDGQRGFGGACLPKDLNNAITSMQNLGVKEWVTQAASYRNFSIDHSKYYEVNVNKDVEEDHRSIVVIAPSLSEDSVSANRSSTS